MKVSLYLVDYEKEIIKKELFYKLKFFDNIEGLIFGTYIHEVKLKNLINYINNGAPKVIENLKKEVLEEVL